MAYNQTYNYGYGYPQYQNGAVPDMLGQFKGQYQQQIMQQPIVQQMQIPTQTNDMIWVLNENEATSYPVAPNNSVVLWDKNEPIIYVKSVNNQGVPSMRILDFIERTAEGTKTPEKHVCKCGDRFVTKEEFDALKGKFYDILAKYDGLLLEQKQNEKEPEIEKPKTSKKAKESEE
jgi:hypothetical protein